MKGFLKGYETSCLIVGAGVLGWNRSTIRIENNIRDRSERCCDRKIETPTFAKQMWRLGRDLALGMVWPITAPFVIKRYIEGTMYNPVDLIYSDKD